MIVDSVLAGNCDRLWFRSKLRHDYHKRAYPLVRVRHVLGSFRQPGQQHRR
uniref:Uncharacterized protein n=1 Tax=Timema monikensis TaxID=170555 RepID=A0A7R9ELI0_9NEOP|nr:unnamed protein product [Timema monikensis]